MRGRTEEEPGRVQVRRGVRGGVTVWKNTEVEKAGLSREGGEPREQEGGGGWVSTVGSQGGTREPGLATQ